jgi:hypothetical protein
MDFSDDEVLSLPDEELVVKPKKTTAKPRGKKNTVEGAKEEMLAKLTQKQLDVAEKKSKSKAQTKDSAKNEDLFEKKYADKFARITDMLTNVETHLSEQKEYKKQKQLQKEQDRAIKAKTLELVKDDLVKLQIAENKVIEENTKVKFKIEAQAVDASILKNYSSPSLLPNYRTMNFGKRIKGKF